MQCACACHDLLQIQYSAINSSSRASPAGCTNVVLTKAPRSASRLHQARTYRKCPSVELSPPIRFVLTVRQLSGTNIQRLTIVSHHRHLPTAGVCLLKATTLLLLQSRVIHPASCVNALQSYTSLRRRLQCSRRVGILHAYLYL
jgi:hypothetical protein